MKIAGIQKLTLLDFPGRCAATIFTPGCNLRCPFCHNASLVEPEDVKKANDTLIKEEDILAYLKSRFGKLTGLAVTGGEPLMQDGLEDFLRKVKELGYAVKLDTNGTYPDKLKAILESGVIDYVAMDFKNSRKNYARCVGLSDAAADVLFDKTLQSLEIIRQSGVDHEFRTTVSAQLHEISDIREIAELLAGEEKYFLQCFTDSGDILADGARGTEQSAAPFTAHSAETMNEMLKAAQEFVPNAKLRGL